MSDPPPSPDRRAPFPTTHWSRVVRAGDADDPGSAEALTALCADYWYPLYAFIRRKGHPPEEAADLVQGTFAALLSRRGLAHVSPDLGRFRAFLIACCRHHIADARGRDRAARRGGGRPPLSIDLPLAERRYAAEPSHDLTPDRLFERRWAIDLLDRTLGLLEAEQADAGKADLFARLLPSLAGHRDGAPYAAIAAEFGLSEGAVKMAASRLRRRFGALLRREIARTVADPADVDDEIDSLFVALAQG